ncbi:MAG: hypothetical protein R3A13_03525 [Bdellovibrionota bacterium]
MKSFGVLIIYLFLFTGCLALKASPAKDSGFLPDADKLVESRDRWPFNGVYISNPTRYPELIKTYNKIYVKEIYTETIKKMIEENESKEKRKSIGLKS